MNCLVVLAALTLAFSLQPSFAPSQPKSTPTPNPKQDAPAKTPSDAAAPVKAADDKPEEIQFKIARITVVRDIWDSKGLEEIERNLIADSPRPGMLIDLVADLPKGTFVNDVVSVENMQASDDTGKDLVGPVLARGAQNPLQARLDSLVPIRPRTRAVRWWIESPASNAKTLTASLGATLQVRSGTDRIEIAKTDQWTRLEHASFGDEKIEYRFWSAGPKLNYVKFRPASAAKHIYRVDPRNTPKGMASDPSGRDHEGVSYLLNTDENPNEKPLVTINTGLRTIRLDWSVKDQPLP